MQRPNEAPAHLLTPEILEHVDALARRRLLLPALLFLSAHRPLAFVAGQLLWMAQPVSGLAPFSPMVQDAVTDWARLLSDPQGPAALEHTLAAYTEPYGNLHDA